MQHTFKLPVRIVLTRTTLPATTAVSQRHLLTSICRKRHISTRRSPANPTFVVKKVAKSEQKLPPTTSASFDPLPDPPPPLKGTPSIISTRDIEEYIQPLYLRGWGLVPILPNGNGIPVLRKRFEFASVDALQDFLADLREYEEKKQVRPSSRTTLRRHPSSSRRSNCISSTMRRRTYLKTSTPYSSARGRTLQES